MSKFLPYDVIAKASEGDAEAVQQVMTHYASYISALSCRYGHFDVEASCRMESKLVQALLKFHLI